MDKRHFLGAGAAALLLATSVRAEDGAFTVDGMVALDAYRSVVEEHLAGVLNALKVAARSSDVQSGEWETVKPLVLELAQDIPSQAAVWYARPDGSYFTAQNGLETQKLSDRDYFPALLAGRTVLGALVVSKSTGHRSVIVAAPVLQDGKMVAALGVSVRARILSDIVTTRTGMPADLTLYALDATGKSAIHRDPERMFIYPSDMGDPSLADAVTRILSNPSGTLSYTIQGKDRAGVFTASALTGWKIVLVRDIN